MKKLGLMSGVVAFGLLFGNTGTLSAAGTNFLAVQFQVTGIIQKTANVTNGTTVTTTLTTTPLKIANQNILNLLQVEFGQSFPAGSQLAYSIATPTGFRVLNSSGNVILDASSNAIDSSYVFSISNNVAGFGPTAMGVGKIVTDSNTGNITTTASVIQPDSGLYYNDSHGNQFHVDGMISLKESESQTSSNTVYNSASFTISGQGGGFVFNPGDGLVDRADFTKVKVTFVGKDIIQ